MDTVQGPGSDILCESHPPTDTDLVSDVSSETGSECPVAESDDLKEEITNDDTESDSYNSEHENVSAISKKDTLQFLQGLVSSLHQLGQCSFYLTFILLSFSTGISVSMFSMLRTVNEVPRTNTYKALAQAQMGSLETATLMDVANLAFDYVKVFTEYRINFINDVNVKFVILPAYLLCLMGLMFSGMSWLGRYMQRAL